MDYQTFSEFFYKSSTVDFYVDYTEFIINKVDTLNSGGSMKIYIKTLIALNMIFCIIKFI